MHSTLEIIEYGFKKDVRFSLRLRILAVTILHDILILVIVAPVLLAGWLDEKHDQYCAMVRKERSE